MPASSSPQPAVLIWFRDDLRLADNPALTAACEAGRPVVCLYVLDEESEGMRPLGGAARWWLHGSLDRLGAALAGHGQKLILRRGPAGAIVPDVARSAGVARVYWNRRYGRETEVDAAVTAKLRAASVTVESFQANLLFDPAEIVSRAGEPFSVYSAFFRAGLARGEPRPPLPAPTRWPVADLRIASDALESWHLLPSKPDWAAGLRQSWTPGEAGAEERLQTFLAEALPRYGEARDFPGESGTSRLSPHLRFGEISPYRIWHAVEQASGHGAAKLRAELGWREFAYHLLGRHPDLASKNIKPAFDRFPWAMPHMHILAAWQKGLTGYPIVDAGMRQLWQTGWMHNRVRMIVASFLTKHLLIDWRVGEAWFWDTLVDADIASNPMNWQWVAGSRRRRAPYFRIFNPLTQGEKFDADGAYVRRYVPEIADLPDDFIHKPWEAPPLVLAAAGVRLGRDYPTESSIMPRRGGRRWKPMLKSGPVGGTARA